MLENIDGEDVLFLRIQHDGPILYYFWASWCAPTFSFLDNAARVYKDWQQETNVKIIGIAIDYDKHKWMVKSRIDSHQWPFEFYVDKSGDLRRYYGMTEESHFILYDTSGIVRWNSSGHVWGVEDEVLEEIRKVN